MVDLRRLHGDLGMMSWDVFKHGVEISVGDLEGVTTSMRTAASKPTTRTMGLTAN
jgi:hypothetical protein